MYGSRCHPEPSRTASTGIALPIMLYDPSRPKRSLVPGTAIDRSKPTLPDWFWASAVGRVIFSAVQATSSAPGVPPVTFETWIGWFDGHVPW